MPISCWSFRREAVASYEARLVSWDGGNMRNAIPREACAVLPFLLKMKKNCWAWWNIAKTCSMKNILQSKHRSALRLNVWNFLPGEVPEEIQDNLIDAIFACQNGVTCMIPTVPDTVQKHLLIWLSLRLAAERLKLRFWPVAPAIVWKNIWLPVSESCFSWQVWRWNDWRIFRMAAERWITRFCMRWRNLINSSLVVEPAVKVIHAGLECGIIGAIIPGWIWFRLVRHCVHRTHRMKELWFLPYRSSMTSWWLL